MINVRIIQFLYKFTKLQNHIIMIYFYALQPMKMYKQICVEKKFKHPSCKQF